MTSKDKFPAYTYRLESIAKPKKPSYHRRESAGSLPLIRLAADSNESRMNGSFSSAANRRGIHSLWVPQNSVSHGLLTPQSAKNGAELNVRPIQLKPKEASKPVAKVASLERRKSLKERVPALPEKPNMEPRSSVVSWAKELGETNKNSEILRWSGVMSAGRQSPRGDGKPSPRVLPDINTTAMGLSVHKSHSEPHSFPRIGKNKERIQLPNSYEMESLNIELGRLSDLNTAEDKVLGVKQDHRECFKKSEKSSTKKEDTIRVTQQVSREVSRHGATCSDQLLTRPLRKTTQPTKNRSSGSQMKTSSVPSVTGTQEAKLLSKQSVPAVRSTELKRKPRKKSTKQTPPQIQIYSDATDARISLLKVREFRGQPVSDPTAVVFHYPTSLPSLSHKQVCDACVEALRFAGGNLISATYEPLNTILATSGLDDRWIVRLDSEEAAKHLVTHGLTIDDRYLYIEPYDKVISTDYNKFLQLKELKAKKAKQDVRTSKINIQIF